jgi:hypothetical protein
MYSNAVRRTLVCSVPVLFSVASWGQSDTGTIIGMVKDTSAAPVPRVKIIVTDARTNTDVFTALTDATGRYTAPALKPSDYVLTAEMTGFKKVLSGPRLPDRTVELPQRTSGAHFPVVASNLSDVRVWRAEEPLNRFERSSAMRAKCSWLSFLNILAAH